MRVVLMLSIPSKILILTAFEAVGQDSSKKPSTKEIVNALSKVKSFKGALGSLKVMSGGIADGN